MRTLGYAIKTAFKGLKRNGMPTFTSVMTLTLSLLIIGCFGMLIANLYVNLQDLDSLNEIVCICEYDLGKEDALKIEDELKALNNVESIEFISKEDALEQMRDRYEAYPEILEMYDKENPLPHTYKIKYQDVDKVSTLKLELKRFDEFKSIDDKVELAQMIEDLKNTLIGVFVGFLVFLLFISIFIITYTIRMAISTRDKEIIVMRYVGATNFFISLPFMIESFFIAVICILVSYGMVFGIYQSIFKYVTLNGQIGNVINLVPFADVWYILLVMIAVVAFLTCFVGSKISLHKHVKV